MGDGIGVLAFVLPSGLGFVMLGGFISIFFTSHRCPLWGCLFYNRLWGFSPLVYPSRGYKAVSLSCQRHWTSLVGRARVLLLYNIGRVCGFFFWVLWMGDLFVILPSLFIAFTSALDIASMTLSVAPLATAMSVLSLVKTNSLSTQTMALFHALAMWLLTLS